MAILISNVLYATYKGIGEARRKKKIAKLKAVYQTKVKEQEELIESVLKKHKGSKMKHNVDYHEKVRFDLF